MGVAHLVSARTASGRPVTAQAFRCLSIGRTPALRQEILAGRFHRVANPEGGTPLLLEKDFVYVDLARKTLILVRPRSKRHDAARTEEALARMAASLAPAGVPLKKLYSRVVFGLEELREKLLIQDAEMDDRLIELVKIYVIDDHPFLTKTARLRISLAAVTTEALRFRAWFDHSKRVFDIAVPHSTYEELAARRPEMNLWLGKRIKANPLTANGKWVNLWTLSPKNKALELLRALEQQLAASTPVIDTTSKDFTYILKHLPTGDHLPDWAKTCLRKLFLWVKGRGLAQLEDQLFEIRFGKRLDDDWYLNDDPNDIDTLWKVLKDLPDTHVEGNSKIREIAVEEMDFGGYWNGSDIVLAAGMGSADGDFDDVLRHEVGHAVHDKNKKLVDDWLRTRFGFESFGPQQIDQWIAKMGGWGNLKTAEKADIRGFLRTAVGPGGTFVAAPRPIAPTGHVWRSTGFAPRLAVEGSLTEWWETNSRWHRAGGKAFALNYYYREFMVIDSAALDLVNDVMPSTYAAMSRFEFFAELYALHYDVGNPANRQVATNIRTWLNTNLGAAATSGQPAKTRANSTD